MSKIHLPAKRTRSHYLTFCKKGIEGLLKTRLLDIGRVTRAPGTYAGTGLRGGQSTTTSRAVSGSDSPHWRAVTKTQEHSRLPRVPKPPCTRRSGGTPAARETTFCMAFLAWQGKLPTWAGSVQGPLKVCAVYRAQNDGR